MPKTKVFIPMQRHLFFFRHGQTAWNVSNIMQGHSDIPLNETGIAQAHVLSSQLQDKHLEIIVSSDSARARQTAEIVATYCGVPVVCTPALREIYAGDFEGVQLDSVIQTPLWAEIFNITPPYAHVSFPHGETKAEVLDRASAYITTFLATTTYTHIGVATHDLVVRLLLYKFTGVDTRGLSNAEWVHVTYDTRTHVWHIKNIEEYRKEVDFET